MDLTGLVDFDAEIKKLTKSLKQTMPAMESLEKLGEEDECCWIRRKRERRFEASKH
jgi:hypothetical protein